MPRMTQAEYLTYLSRAGVKPSGEELSRSDQAEAIMHDDILSECRRRGWIAFHGSMAHATFRTPGEPDFVIVADGGRVFFVECKSGNGKLSTDQLAIHAWMRKLGHKVAVVRSMSEFFFAVNDQGLPDPPPDNPVL